ncbi:BPSS1187 family protein [Chitinophaga lutea]
MRTPFLLCLLLCALAAAGCRKDPADASVRITNVRPQETNAQLTTYNDPHLVAYRPSGGQNGRLFLFLPGTGAKSKNYRYILETAALLGYHAIGLSYPNTPAINAICAGSNDVTSHSRARLEIIDGIDRHDGIEVNAPNSITGRTRSLLQWLQQQFPSENWQQFLTADGLAWNRIVVSGHSQGAGHAGVIGKHYDVQRVILFSGMDFLTNGQIPDWVNNTTHSERYFAFHHESDELLSYPMVRAGWEKLGLGAPQHADSKPYAAHAFYTGEAPALKLANQYHNMTVVDVFTPRSYTEPLWRYFLTF